MVSIHNTTTEIAASDPDIVVIPVGAIEQHGPHLPVGTDAIVAGEVGRRLAQELGAYLLPVLAYGNSQEHLGFKGTVSLRPSTLALVIEDIIVSLRHQGFKRFVVFSTHGGNWVIKPTIRDINFRYPDISVIWANGALPGETDRIPKDIHSGASETSTILAIDESLVKGRGPDFTPDVGQEYNDYVGMHLTTRTGVWGEPSKASKDTGQRRLADVVAREAEYVKATFAKVEALKGPRPD
ncbi:MAG: creatininase family protein [Armatimonadota bacterium]